jgi:ubiquinone/menaquinone biosynthesis C-methylase UbiE
MNQTKIFVKDEADNYFSRNEKKHFLIKDDAILDIYEKCFSKKKIDVLEIGCSDGWRLNIIKERHKADVFGVEPSVKAVNKARKKFGLKNIMTSTADAFSFDYKFDLILIPFVFHWIDRSLLLRSVCNIDKHLNNGGFLLINDFWQTGFKKTIYHHRKDVDIWTYKQDYSKIFSVIGTYKDILHIIYDYGKGEKVNGIYSLTDAKNDYAFISLHRKTSELYEKI